MLQYLGTYEGRDLVNHFIEVQGRSLRVALRRKLSDALNDVAGTVAVVFPQWGITALAVLGFDRFVIRRIPRLRTAFGQR